MCPQAEGRLRGEVDEVRGYHKGCLASGTPPRTHTDSPDRSGRKAGNADVASQLALTTPALYCFRLRRFTHPRSDTRHVPRYRTQRSAVPQCAVRFTRHATCVPVCPTVRPGITYLDTLWIYIFHLGPLLHITDSCDATSVCHSSLLRGHNPRTREPRDRPELASKFCWRGFPGVASKALLLSMSGLNGAGGAPLLVLDVGTPGGDRHVACTDEKVVAQPVEIDGRGRIALACAGRRGRGL